MPKTSDQIGNGIFGPEDLEMMRKAFAHAVSDKNAPDVRDEEEILARAVIRLYKMGLTDPLKLAALAVLMTSSRLLRSAPFAHPFQERQKSA
ncbi:MAG TPA: hypothetical protein VHG11_04710 [Pseudorhizobium sp.]|jgi:hypothetical protein|nr:hypothetical protein [Pseudorhizobium sp.]